MKKLKRFIIPVFIPHEGCRFRCVFCDQYAVTGGDARSISPDNVRETVFRYRETRPHWEGERELAYFGGSFTLLSRQRQEELLAVGRQLIDAGDIDALRVSTRPDGLNERIMDRLERHGVKTVEIGVQSMNDDVLIASKRGHTVSDTAKAARLLTESNVAWIAQIMPGLPGDNDKTMIETASRIADLSPNGVRIYPTLILSGTKLELMYRTGCYVPLTLEHALEIVKTMVAIFEGRSIPIIRIGLCPSAELERRIITGPYHPALGSLVYEARLLDAMIAAVNDMGQPHETTTIRVHPRDISRAIGNGGSSIERLKRRYPGRRFDVIADPSIGRGRAQAHGV